MPDGKGDPTESEDPNFHDEHVNEKNIKKKVEPVARSENNPMIKTRSPLWYELPLLFFIIGGLIAYFKIRKDDPRKARNCLLLGILLTVPLVIVLGLFIAFAIPTGTENPFYVITSGSMEPNLHVFDVVTISRDSFNDLKVGDIIAFNRPSGHDKVIVHRVAEILNKDPLTIRTKGDANTGSIPGTDFPVTDNEYIGKVTHIIPKMGYVTRLLAPPVNNIITVVQIGILLIPIIQHIKYRKKSNL
ncbi:MAG: signal peptidase I [Thaumarchaeota archaeon]|nr:signal peptidase I [Nitrososphaerota archaeon]